uniref:Photolyase/cryptochrome alpha/beta domain-containing protein n=1 Tax=Fagus sylvatica TaxID=28930 RepID=A0A2N9HIV0_FAGSY
MEPDPNAFSPGSNRSGLNRIQFLLESLADLDLNLKRLGSRLLVLKGEPSQVIIRCLNQWGIKKICFEYDTEPYYQALDIKVKDYASTAGIEVFSPVSHTLFNPADIIHKNGGKPPMTYQSFVKLAGQPSSPLSPTLSSLPPLGDLGGCEISHVPTIKQLGYGDIQQDEFSPFRGGESEALKRLKESINNKTSQKHKLLGKAVFNQSTIILTILMCELRLLFRLAVRSFVMFNNALLGKWLWKFELERDALWHRVIVKKYGSEGGGGLLSGLVGGPYGVSLWKYIRKGWETFSQFLEFKVGDGSRIHSWSDVWCGLVPLKASFPELFRITRDKEAYVANHLQEWVAAFEKPKGDPSAFLKPETTILSPYLKIPWNDNDELLVAWRDARTGYPWIDAIMVQLRKWGWMHHLARHSVACFLTRGDLFVHWEKGRDVFERLLIDSDWAINNGNWLWLSCSSFFYQYNRIYSPISFGKKYDPNGDYIRHFLPILKDMPKEYIYEPWTAPLSVQTKAKCIIGRDYPNPGQLWLF